MMMKIEELPGRPPDPIMSGVQKFLITVMLISGDYQPIIAKYLSTTECPLSPPTIH